MNNFKKCSFSILENREIQNLTLRKQKLNKIVMEKRTKRESDLEINPLLLDIDADYRDKKIKDRVIWVNNLRET